MEFSGKQSDMISGFDQGQGQKFFDRVRSSLALGLVGLIVATAGGILYKGGLIPKNAEVEVINADKAAESEVKTIIAEIAGAVEKPGVYSLDQGSRVEDILIKSGGISASADREWVEKYINRAAKLTDGQKIYILNKDEAKSPSSNQSTVESAKNNSSIKPYQGTLGANSTGLVNINTSSLEELDKLPGIGQVYGKSIIEHRPYSTIEDLVKSGAIKQNVFEKIKNLISVF